MKSDQLPTAVRVFARRHDAKSSRSPKSRPTTPKVALVFDTETTIDTAQRLTFGSYRYLRLVDEGPAVCVEEGLFYADELPERDPEGFAVLQSYVRDYQADTASAP